jgi:hypothetical protein
MVPRRQLPLAVVLLAGVAALTPGCASSPRLGQGTPAASAPSVGEQVTATPEGAPVSAASLQRTETVVDATITVSLAHATAVARVTQTTTARAAATAQVVRQERAAAAAQAVAAAEASYLRATRALVGRTWQAHLDLNQALIALGSRQPARAEQRTRAASLQLVSVGRSLSRLRPPTATTRRVQLALTRSLSSYNLAVAHLTRAVLLQLVGQSAGSEVAASRVAIARGAGLLQQTPAQ